MSFFLDIKKYIDFTAK